MEHCNTSVNENKPFIKKGAVGDLKKDLYVLYTSLDILVDVGVLSICLSVCLSVYISPQS